jgi:hypothetical protein
LLALLSLNAVVLVQPRPMDGPPLRSPRLTWYPVAPSAAGHASETLPLPGVAVRVAGGSSCTRRDVAAPWTTEPEVPWTVNCMAHGATLVVVLTVMVALPPPVIVGGVKVAVTPVGKPSWAWRLSVTGPLKPASGVTITV